MTPDGCYERAVPLHSLRQNSLNHIRIADDVEIVVLPQSDGDIHVFLDVCPHMGGPLSKGTYRAADRSLQCPWHGYVFDVESRDLRLNPSEAVYACMRVPSRSFSPDAPVTYKLRELEYERTGDVLYIRKLGSR